VHALARALAERRVRFGPGSPYPARRLAAVPYVPAGCGLRPGETFGLELEHVDFLRREIHVEQQLVTISGQAPYLGPPKTKTSRRTVELPAVTAVALAEHIRAYPPVPVEIEDRTNPRKPHLRTALLLFTNVKGQPLHTSSWTRQWVPAVEAVEGVPAGFGLHGLRHYYATLLIHAGASVKTVQLALGHSSPTVTLNTYVHEWPDVVDRTRSLVDSALGQVPAMARQAGRGSQRAGPGPYASTGRTPLYRRRRAAGGPGCRAASWRPTRDRRGLGVELAARAPDPRPRRAASATRRLASRRTSG
jgi:integrase